jgi:serine/threonine protein kinase
MAQRKTWPPPEPSVFDQGSDDEEIEQFSLDPWHGFHKHGPSCTGDIRAIITPISELALKCCKAGPKLRGAPSEEVELRLCNEGTHFSIGTEATANVTLRFWDLVDEDHGWISLIQARIYLHPDGHGAELYNGSIRLSISARPTGLSELRSICPGAHLRLDAHSLWIIHITDAYTFCLDLRPYQDLYNNLLPRHVLHQAGQCTTLTNATIALKGGESNPEIGCTTLPGGHTSDAIPSSRQIKLPVLPELPALSIISNTFTAQSGPNATLPSNGSDDCNRETLFENERSIVEAYMHLGETTVRKKIRRTVLHQAASQWEREIQIQANLFHPNVTKMLQWDFKDWSIDFEYGGKDLARLKSATNMFDVARDIFDVQQRVLRHSTRALHYLHKEKAIKHLDIKPHNVLLSDDHQTVRLCDFGHARKTDEAVTGGGTHCYIAPEFLLRNETSSASDIWALGITMLYVLNIIPLPGSEPGSEVWEICRLQENSAERRKMVRWLATVKKAVDKIPKEWSVVRKMLIQESEDRIDATGLLEWMKTSMPAGKVETRVLLAA